MTTPQYGWDTDFYGPAKNSRKGHAVKFQNSEHISHLLGSFRFVECLEIVGGWSNNGTIEPVSVCETLQTKIQKIESTKINVSKGKNTK